MRLLVITQYFWPENFRINDLVTEFTRKGHEVTVLTGIPNYPDGRVFEMYHANPSHYDSYEGARVVRVPMISRGTSGFQLFLNYVTFAVSASVAGMFKLRNLEFDVVLAYEPSPVTVGIPAIVIRSVKRIPMVFWVLDIWPETLKAVGVVKSKWILKLVGSLVSYIYQRCDLILAQSKSFISKIENYSGKNKNIEYFPTWAESVFDDVSNDFASEVLFKRNC